MKKPLFERKIGWLCVEAKFLTRADLEKMKKRGWCQLHVEHELATGVKGL